MNEEQLKKTCPPCFTLEQWANWTHAYAAAGGRHALEDFCEDCTPQFRDARACESKCSHRVVFVGNFGEETGVRLVKLGW